MHVISYVGEICLISNNVQALQCGPLIASISGSSFVYVESMFWVYMLFIQGFYAEGAIYPYAKALGHIPTVYIHQSP